MARLSATRLGVSVLLVMIGCVSGFGQEISAPLLRTENAADIVRRINEREAPVPPPEPELPSPPTAVVEELETIEFVLAAVSIEGATVFTAEDFAPLYDEFLSRRVTTADVSGILDRMTGLYREKGYFLSRAVAPPQDLQAGILRIVAIEGYVESVVFEGGAGENALLGPYAERIVRERPLRLDALERAILLINDIGGITVSARLRPKDEARGIYELILSTEYDAVDAFASFDNRGTEGVGPLQAWFGGGLNTVLGRRERLQATVLTVPDNPRELKYGSLSIEKPVGFNGTNLSLFGYLSEVNESAALQPDPQSRAVLLSFRIWHPLIRSRRQNLWLSGNFDLLNSEQELNGATVLKDRVRVLSARADYNLVDSFGGATFLTTQVSQGVGILGAGEVDAALRSRAGGRPDFTKFNFGVTRQQGLSENFGLQFDAAGQISLHPLLFPEQFAVGGSRFGRAYNFSEIAGEHGVAAAVELRYGRDVGEPWLEAFQVYGYYDFGAVWNEVRGAGTIRDSLASAGAGVRFTLLPGLRTDILVAKPLTRPVFDQGNKDVRAFVIVSADF